MEEDIKILEEFKNITFLYGKLAITQEAHKSVSIAIENLIKGYKEKEESEKYLYDAYQDAGKKMFEYSETIDRAKEFIEKILSNGNGANCGDLQMLLDILEEE